MSVSYGLEEYAEVIVKAVHVACSQKGVNHPIICSERERELASHHSLLVFDVISMHDKKDSISAVVAGMDLKPLVDDLPEKLVGEYNSVMAYTAMGDFHHSHSQKFANTLHVSVIFAVIVDLDCIIGSGRSSSCDVPLITLL